MLHRFYSPLPFARPMFIHDVGPNLPYDAAFLCAKNIVGARKLALGELSKEGE